MSKCRKRPWNLYKYKNSVLKSYFPSIIEYGMYLKCLQKPRCLGWFKTSQALRSAVGVEQRWIPWKTISWRKAFVVHKKETESTLLNFLFPFLSFISVFSILKCKPLVLKTTTWWKRASHFVDGWQLLRCQIRFFPHPLNGWHDHWTFVREWGKGDFTDLVWGRIFSQTSLELEMFSPTYNGVKIFFSIIRHKRYFFSAGHLFPGIIYLHAFFPSKSVCRTFFLKSTITPSKVKWSAPKIHQTFGQLTDSDLSIISKGFWTNRGQNSLGERGGIRLYLALPGKSVRTYGDVITRWIVYQILLPMVLHCARFARGGSAKKYAWQLIWAPDVNDLGHVALFVKTKRWTHVVTFFS